MVPAPSSAATKLKIAGEKQKQTASRLRSAAKRVHSFGVRLNSNHRLVKTAVALRTGLHSVRIILSPVYTALDSIHDALDSIKVPKVEFTKGSVMGISVVTGISVESTKPFNATANYFATLATKVEELRGSLQEMETSLTELIDHVPQMKQGILNGAEDLYDAAENLDATGDALIDASKSVPPQPPSPPSFP